MLIIKLNLAEHSTLKYGVKMQACHTESPHNMTQLCMWSTITHLPKPVNIYCSKGLVPLYEAVGIQTLSMKHRKKSLLSIMLEFIGE